MSSVQPLPRPHRLTVGDYYRMAAAGILPATARVELIEGEIIDTAPIGSRHAGPVNRLNQILQRAAGDHAIVSIQLPVRLDETSEPQPDIALLRPRDDFYTQSHPGANDVLLLIEVADTTLNYDRKTKATLYARAIASPSTGLWIPKAAGSCAISIRRTPHMRTSPRLRTWPQ